MNDRDQQPDQRPASGIGRDLRSARDNGKASLQELREFVGTLKGRRPQEVMGIVAGNSLVKGIEMSAIGFVVVLLVFTAIPFYLAGDEPAAKKSPASRASSKTSQQPATGKQAQTGTANSRDDVMDKTGIGETKTFDADENPLEKKLDNLLDGVK
ncbi:MAG: hypothetical protein VB862_16070 [Pirellulaceae bacterium]